jgi:RND family efflux transporter MFP subunit
MLFALAIVLAGCNGKSTEKPNPVSSVPEVHVIKPEQRNLTVSVDQPGFVEAFEQTAIYSKVSGFIQKYDVDIGQHVKKGDPLVEIFVPELHEDRQQKLAQVALNRKMVDVAQSKVQTATARLTEAKANVERSQADIVRWESEVQRLTQMVAQRVVDSQVLDETQKQLASSRASRDAAQAAVAARDAERVAAEADVEAAKSQVNVAEAEERRTAAMLAYTNVTAPYDGVITVRNANTGDYVQAATGDSSSARGSPMFVIARDDLVRIFVDVPETYAAYVREGTKAEVRPAAMSGLEIDATVTRTSWSLMQNTRSMRAEIDLPTNNKYPPAKIIDLAAANENGLRPGRYVNATVIVERLGILVLPQKATIISGNDTFCFLLKDGKAVKTPLTLGLRSGPWIEVAKMKIGGRWVNIDGSEEVIEGKLDELTDGEQVKVAEVKAR